MKLMMIEDFEGTPRTRPVALRTKRPLVFGAGLGTVASDSATDSSLLG
jgi:hypothetical protein